MAVWNSILLLSEGDVQVTPNQGGGAEERRTRDWGEECRQEGRLLNFKCCSIRFAKNGTKLAKFLDWKFYKIWRRNLANILLRVNLKKFPFLSLVYLNNLKPLFYFMVGRLQSSSFFLVFVPPDLAKSRPISYILWGIAYLWSTVKGGWLFLKYIYFVFTKRTSEISYLQSSHNFANKFVKLSVW